MSKYHTCCYCHSVVPTVDGVRKHYARSKVCNQKYQEDIRQTAFTVFDDEQDDTPTPPPSPSIVAEDSEPEDYDLPMPGDDFVLPRRPRSESPGQEPAHNQSKRARVEEVEDEEAPQVGRYPDPYPGNAGETFGEGKTAFEKLQEEQMTEGLDPWAPFENKEEWELAHWLMKNVGQTKADDFLKLPIVSQQLRLLRNLQHLTSHFNKTQNRCHLSFHNNYSFLQKVDRLATGPEWTCEIVTAHGNVVGPDGAMLTEDLELWKRNPVSCIKELIGNPAFCDHILYMPERVYTDKTGQNRIYDEMWTADWWWDTQVSLILFQHKVKYSHIGPVDETA